MHDLPTTISLAILTVAALAATALAFRQLGRTPADERRTRLRDRLVLFCTLGSALVFFYHWFVLRGSRGNWVPLESHVDGLTLIAALLGASILYLQQRSWLPGLAAFALPLLSLVLAWSICASAWTYFVFRIDTGWQIAHLACVYIGSIFLVLGAIAGGMYLFVQHKIRHKRDLTGLSRLASLEAIENFIIHSTGLGFWLLTLGLITGFIVHSHGNTRMGPGWWHSPKIILAAAAWILYALVLNVRHAALFRGARAAWMSIAGAILVLATFTVVTASGVHADARNGATTAPSSIAPSATSATSPVSEPPASPESR